MLNELTNILSNSTQLNYDLIYSKVNLWSTYLQTKARNKIDKSSYLRGELVTCTWTPKFLLWSKEKVVTRTWTCSIPFSSSSIPFESPSEVISVSSHWCQWLHFQVVKESGTATSTYLLRKQQVRALPGEAFQTDKKEKENMKAKPYHQEGIKWQMEMSGLLLFCFHKLESEVGRSTLMAAIPGETFWGSSQYGSRWKKRQKAKDCMGKS